MLCLDEEDERAVQIFGDERLIIVAIAFETREFAHGAGHTLVPAQLTLHESPVHEMGIGQVLLPLHWISHIVAVQKSGPVPPQWRPVDSRYPRRSRRSRHPRRRPTSSSKRLFFSDGSRVIHHSTPAAAQAAPASQQTPPAQLVGAPAADIATQTKAGARTESVRVRGQLDEDLVDGRRLDARVTGEIGLLPRALIEQRFEDGDDGSVLLRWPTAPRVSGWPGRIRAYRSLRHHPRGET